MRVLAKNRMKGGRRCGAGQNLGNREWKRSLRCLMQRSRGSYVHAAFRRRLFF